MKTVKGSVFAAASAILLMMPLSTIVLTQDVAAATEGPSLSCTHDPDSQGTCDLAVDKQVSFNGGPFVEADTSADAAQGHVGETVVWKITVTNTSTSGFEPTGTVYVQDILPSAGVSYVSSTATAGSYITSGFFQNYWELPLLQSDGEDGFVTTLPATLTITSTATSVGLFQNTATLAKYDNGRCDGGCTYADDNDSNDSNDAWIDPSTQPQVLGSSTTDPTLTNTGSGVTESIVAGGLIAITLAVVLVGRRSSKYTAGKL